MYHFSIKPLLNILDIKPLQPNNLAISCPIIRSEKENHRMQNCEREKKPDLIHVVSLVDNGVDHTYSLRHSGWSGLQIIVWCSDNWEDKTNIGVKTGPGGTRKVRKLELFDAYPYIKPNKVIGNWK